MQLEELKATLSAALAKAKEGLQNCETEIRKQEEMRGQFSNDVIRIEAAMKAIENPIPAKAAGARRGRKPKTETPPATP